MSRYCFRSWKADRLSLTKAFTCRLIKQIPRWYIFIQAVLCPETSLGIHTPQGWESRCMSLSLTCSGHWPCEFVPAAVQFQKAIYRAPLPPIPFHSIPKPWWSAQYCGYNEIGTLFLSGRADRVPAFSMRSSCSLWRKLTVPVQFLRSSTLPATSATLLQ